MDEEFNGVLQKDIFISSTASSDNDIALPFASFDHDINFEDDFVGIKMEPSDETSDYHGSSSGSPSSSLSSPNNMKDEPLGLDINFCGPFSASNFSPAPGSSHSPGIGMLNGGGPVSQQPSPLPPVSHFSHAHIQQNHQIGVPQMFNNQHQIHHNLPQYAGNQSHNFMFKDAMYYDGIGGMGLAAAQQQLKSRNKMHEMAVKQRLITDQVSETFPMSGDVQLSAEEKRTLIQEGYAVPSRYPLTKTEEEALKIVRRKIKNKLSAQESRRKRKEYMDALEIRVQGCVQENSYLKTRVRQLETANRELAMKLQAYEEREQNMRPQQ